MPSLPRAMTLSEEGVRPLCSNVDGLMRLYSSHLSRFGPTVTQSLLESIEDQQNSLDDDSRWGKVVSAAESWLLVDSSAETSDDMPKGPQSTGNVDSAPVTHWILKAILTHLEKFKNASSRDFTLEFTLDETFDACPDENHPKSGCWRIQIDRPEKNKVRTSVELTRDNDPTNPSPLCHSITFDVDEVALEDSRLLQEQAERRRSSTPRMKVSRSFNSPFRRALLGNPEALLFEGIPTYKLLTFVESAIQVTEDDQVKLRIGQLLLLLSTSECAKASERLPYGTKRTLMLLMIGVDDRTTEGVGFSDGFLAVNEKHIPFALDVLISLPGSDLILFLPLLTLNMRLQMFQRLEEKYPGCMANFQGAPPKSPDEEERLRVETSVDIITESLSEENLAVVLAKLSAEAFAPVYIKRYEVASWDEGLYEDLYPEPNQIIMNWAKENGLPSALYEGLPVSASNSVTDDPNSPRGIWARLGEKRITDQISAEDLAKAGFLLLQLPEKRVEKVLQRNPGLSIPLLDLLKNIHLKFDAVEALEKRTMTAMIAPTDYLLSWIESVNSSAMNICPDLLSAAIERASLNTDPELSQDWELRISHLFDLCRSSGTIPFGCLMYYPTAANMWFLGMPHLVPATQGAADAQRRDYAVELKELIESRRHEDGHEEKVSHYPMCILLQPEGTFSKCLEDATQGDLAKGIKQMESWLKFIRKMKDLTKIELVSIKLQGRENQIEKAKIELEVKKERKAEEELE